MLLRRSGRLVGSGWAGSAGWERPLQGQAATFHSRRLVPAEPFPYLKGVREAGVAVLGEHLEILGNHCGYRRLGEVVVLVLGARRVFRVNNLRSGLLQQAGLMTWGACQVGKANHFRIGIVRKLVVVRCGEQ